MVELFLTLGNFEQYNTKLMSEFPKFELVIVIIEARKSKPMMLVCLQVLGYRWLVSCW